MNHKQKKIIHLDLALRKEILAGLRRHGKIKIVGLGTFEVKKAKARSGHNPLTGKDMRIRSYYRIKFKATKKLKDGVC